MDTLQNSHKTCEAMCRPGFAHRLAGMDYRPISARTCAAQPVARPSRL